MTDADVAQFHAEGFLVVRAVVEPRLLTALHEATDALEAAARDVVVDTAGERGVFFEVQSASGRKREPAVFPGALRKITGPSKATAAFQRLKNHKRLEADCVALGVTSPRCVVDQVNLKVPRHGTGFPFHQDAAFLHGAAARGLTRGGGLNVVVALDPASEENGGFIVVRGSHTRGLFPAPDYDTSRSLAEAFGVNERDCVCPRLAPGDAVYFSPWLLHGSGPNPSPHRRRLATLWFTSTAR